jgi:outer membrane protein assembly factor BamA
MASASLVYDSRREPARPGSAWYVELWGEKGFDNGPGEFAYEAFSIDLRKYMRLPYRFRLDLRGKLFSTLGEAPHQVYQSLGGYGGVRGLWDHPFDVRRGNRMTVYTVELRRQLPDVRFVSALFTSWDFLLFSDVGLLAEAEDPNDAVEFLKIPFDDWGKSLGVGISGESILPYVGVYVARGVQGGQGSWRAILRIERSF